MEAIEVIYLVCFFVGVGFSVISLLLAGVFSGAEGVGDMDAGGMDVDVDVDVDGGDAPDGTGGTEVSFPLWSPSTIALFVGSFGGVGYILKQSDLPLMVQIPAAAASGVVLALMLAYILYRVFQLTGGSSAEGLSEVIGIEAQVSTAIPSDGVGEISYSVGMNRRTAPARSVDGKEISARSLVKIAKVVGNIFYVQRVV